LGDVERKEDEEDEESRRKRWTLGEVDDVKGVKGEEIVLRRGQGRAHVLYISMARDRNGREQRTHEKQAKR
jgi:hypothetical protein